MLSIMSKFVLLDLPELHFYFTFTSWCQNNIFSSSGGLVPELSWVSTAIFDA